MKNVDPLKKKLLSLLIIRTDERVSMKKNRNDICESNAYGIRDWKSNRQKKLLHIE